MKRTLFAVLLPLALATPAFAQTTLEQPALPHDGVGVDYTQPWLNDLLLRSEAREDAFIVRDRPLFRYSTPECVDEADSMRRAPDDPAARQAFKDCMDEHRPHFVLPAPPPGPGLRPPLLIPERTDRTPDLRIPLAPGHPNAQN